MSFSTQILVTNCRLITKEWTNHYYFYFIIYLLLLFLRLPCMPRATRKGSARHFWRARHQLRSPELEPRYKTINSQPMPNQWRTRTLKYVILLYQRNYIYLPLLKLGWQEMVGMVHVLLRFRIHSKISTYCPVLVKKKSGGLCVLVSNVFTCKLTPPLLPDFWMPNRFWFHLLAQETLTLIVVYRPPSTQQGTSPAVFYNGVVTASWIYQLTTRTPVNLRGLQHSCRYFHKYRSQAFHDLLESAGRNSWFVVPHM